MRNWLPLCFAAAVFAAPVQAQYIFLDANRDQVCNSADVPPYEEGTIDVWLNTSEDAVGEPAVCPTGEELTLSSYEVVFGLVNITVTGWANSRPEFAQSLGVLTAGRLAYVGFASGGSTQLPPGLYKLGTMSTRSTGGCMQVQIVPGAVFSGTRHDTQFYSQCLGLDGDYKMNLGQDFFDTCLVGNICDSADDPSSSTWGKIKQRYLDK